MAEQNITKRRLNDKQLAILHELYCYRIATSTLLAQSLHASNIDDINKRLQRLMKNGYIGRKHEKSYRLIHRPASYYLLPDGVNAIAASSHDKYSKPVLASIKRMKDPSQRFIRTSLSLYGIRNVLNAALGEMINIFSASETAIYDYFPKKRPALYIQYQDSSTLKQYFLIYVESNKPMYANIRKVKDYIEYADEGEWEITKSPLPALLLVCDRKQIIDRTISAINAIDDDIDDELDIYIASADEIKHDLRAVLWRNVFDTDITKIIFK
jgi:hypothetical protein